MDDKKKNKNKSPAWAVVVLLLMLLRALNDGNMAVLPVIIIGLSIVAVIGIVMASTKKQMPVAAKSRSLRALLGLPRGKKSPCAFGRSAQPFSRGGKHIRRITAISISPSSTDF